MTIANKVVPEGTIFNYEPWRGDCVAEWHGNDLWVRKIGCGTDKTGIFKTQNGDGVRLTKLNRVIRVLWDNTSYLEAYMPDKKTITVRHGDKLYHFNRVPNLREGNKFNYSPWGGCCTVSWHGDDVWVTRDGFGTGGTRVFKTENGDGKILAKGMRVVNVLWDNSDYKEAYMSDNNTIQVRHGDKLYQFERISQ